MIMEDVIERMRRDISLNVNANRSRDGASSFNVSFESPDARTAMRVTERLASLFVQENLEDRELLADQTNQFLQGQLEEARRRLLEHEKKLQDFRQRNNGQLPEQVSTNLQMMQSAQMQLQNVVESANRDRDRLLALERDLADAPPSADAVAGPPRSRVETSLRRLCRAAARDSQEPAAPRCDCGSSPSIPTSAARSA